MALQGHFEILPVPPNPPYPPFCGRDAMSPNNSPLIPVPKPVNEAKEKGVHWFRCVVSTEKKETDKRLRDVLHPAEMVNLERVRCLNQKKKKKLSQSLADTKLT